MVKIFNYTLVVLLLVMVAGLPALFLVLLLNFAEVNLRHGFWVSVFLSFLIIPLWILVSDGLEIFLKSLLQSSRATAVLSVVLSFLVLASIYYCFLFESFLVSLYAATVICCFIMAIRPYILSKYEAYSKN